MHVSERPANRGSAAGHANVPELPRLSRLDSPFDRENAWRRLPRTAAFDVYWVSLTRKPGPVVDVEDAVISPESMSPYPFSAVRGLSRQGAHSEVQRNAYPDECSRRAPVSGKRAVGRPVREQVSVLRVLDEISRIASSAFDTGPVYERIARHLKRLIPFDRIAVHTVDIERGSLALVYAAGSDAPGQTGSEVTALAETPMAAVVMSRSGMVLSAESPGEGAPRHPGKAPSVESRARSSLMVPVVSGGAIVGVMSLSSNAPDAYSERDLALADRVAAATACAVAQSQLQAENRELRRESQANGRFLSSVFHELRTPLTSMIAFSDILARNSPGNLDERQTEQIEIVRRNGRRLQALINDLLNVSRMGVSGIGSGRVKLTRAKFDARQLLDEVARNFRPILEENGQTLETSIPGEALWLNADRDRLMQVLSNLVSNASKYSPAGARVEMAASVERSSLCVAVKDHGIGISEEDMSRLFTPFFRADNPETRATTGSGLGLAIAKSIMDLHGGRITVESRPAEGSTFTVRVPGVLPAQAAPAFERG